MHWKSTAHLFQISHILICSDALKAAASYLCCEQHQPTTLPRELLESFHTSFQV